MLRVFGLIVYKALLVTAPCLFATGGTVATPSSNCLECHTERLDGSSLHFISADEDCLVCHTIVGEDENHVLLNNAGTDLCADCHVLESYNHAATEHHSLACTTCHNPHGSEYDHNHIADHNTMCLSSCHTLHELGRSHPRGAGTRDKLTGAELTCVSACHSNHSADYPLLLQQEPPQLCARCHPDKF